MTITITNYLAEKGIKIIKNEGRELVIHCLFGSCDADSKGSEAHLYVEAETGRFHCKKCGASGGVKKLREHFGDLSLPKQAQEKSAKYFTSKLVEECVNNLPDRIRKYLNDRGVSNEIILNKKIGFGNFNGSNWITIPIIKTGEIEYSFFLLRKDPENTNPDCPKNISFPKGKGEVILYGDFAGKDEDLIITEGIMDCLCLLSCGKKAVFSTGGCQTFKDEWVDEKLLSAKNIFVAYDRDEAGEKGAEKVLKLLKNAKYKNLHKIVLPDEVGNKGDVNDYVAKLKLPVDDLLTKYSESYPKQIDAKQFYEMSLQDLNDVLSLTIKGDRDTKLITFFCQLSAFTEDNQFNIMFNSPSSTGKSYIALECSYLFPKDKIMALDNVSAMAFFHDNGKYNKETNTITIDLSKMILIFKENPHYELLKKLRSFLSHDEKISVSKITDKNQKGGNKTKTIELIGYASVVFCTASLKSDVQEKTRFIILSPEISNEKITAGIKRVIDKGKMSDKYAEEIENNLSRKALKLRIEAIRNAEIENIYMSEEDSKYLEEKFFASIKSLQPRHQRDIQRVVCLVKSIALLNLWFRDYKNNSITINRSDIDNGLELYSQISVTQSLGISPYLYRFHKDIVRACHQEENWKSAGIDFNGITYQQIMNFHFKIKNSKLNYNYLRQEIIPELEACGLIEKEYVGNKMFIKLTDTSDDNSSEVMSGEKI